MAIATGRIAPVFETFEWQDNFYIGKYRSNYKMLSVQFFVKKSHICFSNVDLRLLSLNTSTPFCNRILALYPVRYHKSWRCVSYLMFGSFTLVLRPFHLISANSEIRVIMSQVDIVIKKRTFIHSGGSRLYRVKLLCILGLPHPS